MFSEEQKAVNVAVIVDFGYSLACRAFTTILEVCILETPHCCVTGLGYGVSIGFMPKLTQVIRAEKSTSLRALPLCCLGLMLSTYEST